MLSVPKDYSRGPDILSQDWAKIAESNPFTTLPWDLLPARQTQHAPPIMCYGVDIDPDVLLKYATEHDLIVYYDEVPLCPESEFDGDGDLGVGLFGGIGIDSGHFASQDDQSTSVASGTGTYGDDGGDIAGVESVNQKLLSLFLSGDSESEEDGPSIDRMASMMAALRAMGEENGVSIPPFCKITCGEQRSAVRETSLIASFYTNYDIQTAVELPSKEEIEKLREGLGSAYPPGWYLDRNNNTWVSYADD